MKMTVVRTFAACCLLVLFSLSSCGQASVRTTKYGINEKAKLEKIKIPPVVIKNFYDQYPAPVDEEWYSYPAVDIQYSWYDYNPYAFTVDPETYVVAFVKDNVPYKVVYGKNGEKISTHRILNTDLPSAITKRLSQGEYKDWTVGKDKEEIFRDKDTDQLKVYKLDVEKGTGKHTLYFQADGKLLKDRKVS